MKPPTNAELLETFKRGAKPQPTSVDWWMGQLIPRDRELEPGEAALIAADIKRRVRRARVLEALKLIGLAVGAPLAIAILIGSCVFGQISCQQRLHDQGVPFGDDRMEVCFN